MKQCNEQEKIEKIDNRTTLDSLRKRLHLKATCTASGHNLAIHIVAQPWVPMVLFGTLAISTANKTIEFFLANQFFVMATQRHKLYPRGKSLKQKNVKEVWKGALNLLRSKHCTACISRQHVRIKTLRMWRSKLRGCVSETTNWFCPKTSLLTAPRNVLTTTFTAASPCTQPSALLSKVKHRPVLDNQPPHNYC